MNTTYLKSGRRVQYSVGPDRDVRFGFYAFEIDALIRTIKAAYEQKVFCCALLLDDLLELQEHFLEVEGTTMLFGEVWDRFSALPKEEQTTERFQAMHREAGL